MEQVILHDGALAQATSLLYITSNLTYEWIDSVQKTASNLRVCTCFVVKQKDGKLLKMNKSCTRYAASRGIRCSYYYERSFCPSVFGGESFMNKKDSFIFFHLFFCIYFNG